MPAALVAGTGITEFGEHPDRTSRDLFADAGLAALADAGVDPGDVDELFYGNFAGEITESQGHQAPLVAEAVGVDAPATRFESACASSGVAVRRAVTAIRAGEVDVALVGGAERMTSVDRDDSTAALATAADALYEARQGMTFPAAYALMEDAYFDAYGGTPEDLAHVAVKNHANAVDNDHAQFREEITVEDVLDAPRIADPIGLYDACPVTDGASAVVLASETAAAARGLDAPVAVAGAGQATDRLALQDRASLADTPATADAAAAAYADAGIDADDVDVAEVHDCFTVAEAMAVEALGFCDPGDGVTAARRGVTTPDGPVPVNLSGGLKAKGHPVGATGTSQVAELADLLAGDSHASGVVPDARVGVAHNAGGTVASATVHVLEVVE